MCNLQSVISSAFLLQIQDWTITGGLCLPVTIVPATAVRFPGAETHPAKVRLAVLILTDHMVTATILFYRNIALRTLLRVSCYPVRRFRVVVAFLQKKKIDKLVIDYF